MHTSIGDIGNEKTNTPLKTLIPFKCFSLLVYKDLKIWEGKLETRRVRAWMQEKTPQMDDGNAFDLHDR